MNILTIHHLCYYLEEIGIIDQISLPPFLSLYSFVLNKTKENENKNKKPQNIFENVLCAYLKKIFSVEKNYKIFSNKIINKFKQHFILKQYNGITLLFAILRKNLNSSKIQSYYKILNIYNNNTKNNSSFQDDSPINENKFTSKHKKKKSFDSFRFKYMNIKKSKLKDDSNNNRSDIFNKSVDYIKFRPRNTIQSLNNRNNSQLVNLKGKNIQLEFKKRQFLSKIKREHTVKFKRSNSQTMVKNNSSARHNKSEIFRDFSTSRISKIMNKNRKNKIPIKNNFKKEYTLNPNDFHFYNNLINEYYNSSNNNNNYENNDYFDDHKNNINYDDNIDDNNYENEKEAIPTQSNYSNNINLTSFYNNYDQFDNFDYDIKKDYVPNSVKGGFSFKSKYGNFNPFNYPTVSNNKMNTISNYKMSGGNYMGHIIKKDLNNTMKNQNKQNVLTPKEIHRIKEKLEKLNYFNFNS